jgi:Zn-finger nucleic acid-binding protein
MNEILSEMPSSTLPLPCPVCRLPMLPETAHGLELDRCAQCRGLWFDHPELDIYIRRLGRLHANAISPPIRLLDAGNLLCPRCLDPSLEAWRSDSVNLSRCSRCLGIFLDGDDVSALRGRRPTYQVPPPPGVLSKLPSTVEDVFELALEFVVRVLSHWP